MRGKKNMTWLGLKQNSRRTDVSTSVFFFFLYQVFGLNPNLDVNIRLAEEIGSRSARDRAFRVESRNDEMWWVHLWVCNGCLWCLPVFHNLFKDIWDQVLKWTKGQAWISSWFSAALGLMRGKSVAFFLPPAVKDAYHPLLVQTWICQRLSNNPSICNSIKEHFRQTGLLELTSWENSTWAGSNTYCTQCGALAFVRFGWSRSSLLAVLST